MSGSYDTVACAGYLCRSIGRVVGCLDGLDLDEQRWRPPAPHTNSLLAIAAHAVANAEENVLGLLGGAALDRHRTAEFDDGSAGAEAIRQRWQALEPLLGQMVGELSETTLGAEVIHPRRGRLRGFDVLIVALRHAAEHQGQAELTRQLILARRAT